MSGRTEHLFQVDCSVKTWKYSWQGSNKCDSFRLELLQVPEDYEFHSFFLRILEKASGQNFSFLSFFFFSPTAFDSYSFCLGWFWHWITCDGNSMGLGKKEFCMHVLGSPLKWWRADAVALVICINGFVLNPNRTPKRSVLENRALWFFSEKKHGLLSAPPSKLGMQEDSRNRVSLQRLSLRKFIFTTGEATFFYDI